MDRPQVEQIVREWLDVASVDPTTGAPPDAKVTVDAHYLMAFGHLKPGQSRPDQGKGWWRVTATVYFRDEGPPDEPSDVGLAISRVLSRLEESLTRDRTLSGQVSSARWRGTDGDEPTEPPDAPEEYPNAVEVYVAVTT